MRRGGSFLFIIIAIVSVRAGAFPELVRHGYASCRTCHVSPDGGGVLTPYGRSLSGELLSSWGNEKEAGVLHGAVTLPESIHLGGDVRWIQTYVDNPMIRSFRSMLMQADAEAGVTVEGVTLVATAGYHEPPPGGKFEDGLISRRHYVMLPIGDTISLRAGRFGVAYGLRLADHAVEVKRGLGWDYGTETYNVEAAWLGEQWEIFATGTVGRFDKPELDRDRGLALRVARTIGETSKAGVSYLYGDKASSSRHLTGAFALLGLSHRWSLLLEADLQRMLPDAGGGYWSLAGYSRLGFEMTKGLHAFATQEIFQPLGVGMPGREAYGVGLQFFPRPHFEITAHLQKRKSPAFPGFTDMMFAMLHYYL